MATIKWANPAYSQLESVLNFIALDKPLAARALAGKVLKAVDRLQHFPASGRRPPEIPNGIYREVVCPPLRIFYRVSKNEVLIVHVMRQEQVLRQFLLKAPG